MSEYLSLLLLSLQILIYNKLFNENIVISVNNFVSKSYNNYPQKIKTDGDELIQYRKAEKEKATIEQSLMKKAADTLYYKSQTLPQKRNNGVNVIERLKKAKRETVRVMNEDLPVYKTTQFIEELPVTPMFSKEETMPRYSRSLKSPVESN
jgi:hypothetical protein